MNTRPEITCTCCRGSGIMPLPATLWNVLTIVRAAGQEGICASDVHAKIVAAGDIVVVTAINNRLRALAELGLVEVFSKWGKTLIWVATK